MRFLKAAGICLMLSAPAHASDTTPAAPPTEAPQTAPAPVPPPPVPVAPTPAVTAFAREHPQCAEISDSCIICAVETDAIHCSTPGIACIKSDLTCKKDKPTP